MYKTVACKYRTTKRKTIEKYRINKDFGIRYKSKDGTEKIRTFWKGSHSRDPYPQGAEVDIIPKPKGILKMKKPTFAVRMKHNMCEWCGQTDTDVLVHQVRSLKDLKCENEWERFMKHINRKTLVVCKACFKIMTM